MLNILALLEKESSPNRKFTSQKATNIYIWKFLVKFLLDPVIGLRVLLDNIKLENKYNYVGI